MQKVYITGIGIITSIGNGVAQTFDALCTGKHGIEPVRNLQSIHNEKFMAGQIILTTSELMMYLGLPKEDSRKYTRTSLLAMIAAKEAYENANIKHSEKCRTGIVSANTVGGMPIAENLYPFDIKDEYDYPTILSCGDSTERVAEYLKIKDFASTISTACSSSTNSIMYAARLIKHGKLDRAIAGGADAMTKFALNGFNSLFILDNEHCKPFDKNRKGLNLGEGAAYLVLESEEVVKREGKLVIAELTGYANTNDTFHQTASSPEGDGAYKAMSEALENSGLKPKDISYINVHGTGTQNNDLSEGNAIKRLFKKIPPFSSTKAYTGHTLGAAGAVEAVFSLLALKNNVLIPNLNFNNQIEELGISPQAKLVENANVEHVLTNSFGFGGNNTTLIFSDVKM